MSAILSLIEILEQWAVPRLAIHHGQECPFLLSCELDSARERRVRSEMLSADSGLNEFWCNVHSARLFEDKEYGQWGLHIFSSVEAIRETERQLRDRGKDFIGGILVIGEFFGDSDLLVLDTRNAADGKCPVLIALPIDSREVWPIIADSFTQFLEYFVEAQGGKFWDIRI